MPSPIAAVGAVWDALWWQPGIQGLALFAKVYGPQRAAYESFVASQLQVPLAFAGIKTFLSDSPVYV
jgi:hypothetical protein